MYGGAVREALVVAWEASDRVCGKRLRALVPMLVEAMERHGHLQLAAGVRLVAHSGPAARGSFVQALTVTDIATGWTECAPVPVREQALLAAVLGEIRRLMRVLTEAAQVFRPDGVRYSELIPSSVSI